jgi:hypothetical protein
MGLGRTIGKRTLTRLKEKRNLVNVGSLLFGKGTHIRSYRASPSQQGTLIADTEGRPKSANIKTLFPRASALRSSPHRSTRRLRQLPKSKEIHVSKFMRAQSSGAKLSCGGASQSALCCRHLGPYSVDF